ncbi:gamma-glutamylcyclotransferase [Flavobacteriaceae bacterium XHP0103]|uniref:gamma-glutamylcyclotransferase family protein n=1 Tax=Marixanthotalea marina TaxID=2844359 RepID=UPI002989B8C5|nr:gamma-glutamylcyclotransferase family protein [Marixanthotalea marina]MBU3821620.1 gamma-glutamylcyclotransferase [Marixanthotalea marina]
MQYLFVYGTLKKGYKHPMASFLNHHSEFLGRGFFQGQLYMVAHYPGAVLSEKPEDKVHGHVFKLLNNEDEVFKTLDAYEGIDPKSADPDLYRRELVKVHMETLGTINAWVYIYNLPTDNLTLIPSGKFIK